MNIRKYRTGDLSRIKNPLEPIPRDYPEQEPPGSDFSYTLVDNQGNPLIAGGLIPQENGVHKIWIRIDQTVKTSMLVKLLMGILLVIREEFGSPLTLEANVLCYYPVGIRFAEWFGFRETGVKEENGFEFRTYQLCLD